MASESEIIPELVENKLRKIWEMQGSPAFFAGASTLWREAKGRIPRLSKRMVEDFLHRQYTYTLHKQRRRRFGRNRTVAVAVDSHWQADLIDMQQFKKFNLAKFILVVIDVLSKYTWLRALKNKTPEAVLEAFLDILSASGRSPWQLLTDKGTEFKSVFHRTLEDRLGIAHVFSESPDIKTSVCEWRNRDVQGRLRKYFTRTNGWEWESVLPGLEKSLNGAYSRVLGTSPAQATPAKQAEIFRRLYGSGGRDIVGPPPTFGFKLGERVRIQTERAAFTKGTAPRFSKEIFVVAERVPRRPPVYKISDLNGEMIRGVFYGSELVKAGERNQPQPHQHHHQRRGHEAGGRGGRASARGARGRGRGRGRGRSGP